MNITKNWRRCDREALARLIKETASYMDEQNAYKDTEGILESFTEELLTFVRQSCDISYIFDEREIQNLIEEAIEDYK